MRNERCHNEDAAMCRAHVGRSSGATTTPTGAIQRLAGSPGDRQIVLLSLDALAAAIAVLFVVAFVPPTMFPNWTPRMALLLATGPIGIYATSRLAASRDPSATALVIALLWAVLVGAISDGPRSALLGFAGRDVSTLTVVLAGGLWAVGRHVSRPGVTALTQALVWSAACSAIVGVLQVVLKVEAGPLVLYDGRPSGLLTNPVYFGAVCAAALMAAADKCAHGHWRRFAPPAVLLAVGTSLSGSRTALGAACLTMVGYCLVHRRRTSLWASAVVAASLAAGIVIDRAFGAGRNAANRLGEGSGGRTIAWRYGLQAWLDKPLTGNGLGRFRPAVQSRFSPEFVRDYAPDDARQAWFDAHNVLIGLLVAVGLVGLVLLVAWAVLWLSQIRGPLAWALIPLVLHWMLQPISLVSLPLAMLLFGAAGAARSPVRSLSRTSSSALVTVGLLLAACLLLGDVLLRRAVDRGNGDRAAAVARVVGDDPIVADVVAQIYASDPGRLSDALAWRLRAAEAEPDRPLWWSKLALIQIDAGRYGAANDSIARAYALQRVNLRTIRTEGRLAIAERDEDRLTRVLAELCALDQPECETTAAELLARSSSPQEP